MALITSFKLPCGTKGHYPEKLDYLTRKGGICVFFVSSDKTDDSYLIAPGKKSIQIIGTGSIIQVATCYESIELEEQEVGNSSNEFAFKYAESEEVFKKALEKVAEEIKVMWEN
ncbi:hypothetical protein [Paenibacillus sp. NEAU-GSW1]|uniref:hypothetical protein n=1 Tax=Paenibacillus sp. NEAU-GSW1 TaxID=2682486 RepID=UPI0012E13065|nr:hypothetical protein [Paenibacillus sp. NEAU-GSW1]MUT68696.1 hypothetical protein [Paenibacillus sp. NEAU-GSW1]